MKADTSGLNEFYDFIAPYLNHPELAVTGKFGNLSEGFKKIFSIRLALYEALASSDPSSHILRMTLI